MCKGKFLLAQGNLEVDQDIRDVVVSIIPVGKVSKYVKPIVESVVREDRYLTVPAWYKMMYVWELMCPQVVDWLLRLAYLSEPGTPATETLSKKLLDASGAKNFLYPSYIRSPQLKAD
ncbi:hypothetical protein L6164_010920 [Bauhinia variegata]|uniref:Uncharacterized protein n=1 Tax=Bauhinia variegata TaxID=167791 RepID=A0ACB9P5H5_BAUVA|nr:hypothetical protein L6164_010920 [Bauhinia variegata]